MTLCGKTARVLAAVVVLCWGTSVQGAVSAAVDRDKVAVGESLRLTITVSGDEQPGEADLRPLLEDFELLQRSTSSQTRYINGRTTHTRQLLVDLAPTRQGQITIPALRVGDARTQPIAIEVTAASDLETGGEALLFEAEVDRDSVYVQGQLLLTLRIMQAVNLEDRGISELEMEDAFVKPLEQKTYQRTVDGQPWLVHEVRYAIFPEQSGTLTIPSQEFTAREVVGRRGLFQRGGGRLLRRTTQPLKIEVLPQPSAYPGTTWLPARELTVEEQWSTPPDQLRTGESATRTIRLRGEGLQGAQLPPIMFPPVDGLKFYPDQPEISEEEIDSGLLGMRRDSAAIVPTRAGTVTLPEIRIPWWDTEQQRTRYAVLPERQFSVAPAAATTPAPPAQTTAPAATQPAPQVSESPSGAGALPWQVLSAITSLGWLVTLGYLVWMHWHGRRQGAPVEPGDVSERRAWKDLVAACEQNRAEQTRGALLRWARAFTGDDALISLQQVSATLADDALRGELQRLDQSLYGGSAGQWRGAALAQCLQRLRKSTRDTHAGNEQLRLYPDQWGQSH
ncbi:MAG: BatD family protein [Halioglobus sp.]|nr:BatD family protein [Halioglobus sp.]